MFRIIPDICWPKRNPRFPSWASVLLRDSIAIPNPVIFPDSFILNPEQVGFLPRHPGLSVEQAQLPQLSSMDGFGFSGTAGWSPASIEILGPSKSPGRMDSQLVGL